jgi:hypothetical protein
VLDPMLAFIRNSLAASVPVQRENR